MQVLASQGAEIIAYVSNAIGTTRGDGLWRAHMISRAGELQRFVVGANNAAADQTCPTMIVSPMGQILSEVEIGAVGAASAVLDLTEVADWVLSQGRNDVKC